jgi:uncharacterized membrane protein
MKNYTLLFILLICFACNQKQAMVTIPDMVCFGNEPNWSVEISEKKQTIHFKEMDGENIVFDYVKPSIKGDNQIFSVKKDNNTLNITVTKGTCGDGMSDTKHTFSSKITFNNKPYTGCGRLK